MLYKCILIYKNDMLMIKKEHLVSDISKLKKVYAMPFAKIYPMLVAKAVRKGRTQGLLTRDRFKFCVNVKN